MKVLNANPFFMEFLESSDFKNSDAMKDILNFLYREKIKDIVIIGGVAVFLNGFKRSTMDIDFLVSRESALKIRDHFQSLGYKITTSKDSNKDLSFIRLEKGSAIIELILALEFYQRKAMKNNKEAEMMGFRIKYTSPENIIELKLKAISQSSILNNRILDSSDIRDIREMIRINNFSKLDISSFKKFALAIGIDEDLVSKIFS